MRRNNLSPHCLAGYLHGERKRLRAEARVGPQVARFRQVFSPLDASGGTRASVSSSLTNGSHYNGGSTIRRLYTLLCTALVIGAVGLTSPASTYAADPDGNPYVGNLAGQPICGNAANNIPGTSGWCNSNLNSTACPGIAYAAVNNKMALLTAWHCRPEAYKSPGIVCHVAPPVGVGPCDVYGPNGSIIGFWGNNYDTEHHDFSLIWLYQGNWPANRNRIARGDYSPNNPYWEMTANPTAVLGCDNHWGPGDDIQAGRTTYQNWQYEVGDETLFRTGTITGAFGSFPADSCHIKTSLIYHEGLGLCGDNPSNQCIDSGTPFVLCCNAEGWTHTLYGWASLQDASDGKLVLVTAYDAIYDLNNWMVTYGSAHTGAWICQTPTCGGVGGY